MIAYERVGSGPPLVLVHGITESRRVWDPLLDALAGNHDVVAVDLRGHGLSPASPPYDIGTFAADVHEVVNGLGLAPPLLIGHSLGGAVVTACATMFAVRGVINIDQSLNLAEFKELLGSVEPKLRNEFHPTVATILDTFRGALSDAEWARVSALRHVDENVVMGVWSVVLDSSAEQLDAIVRTMASGVSVPYLALNGSGSSGYAKWLIDLIPTATVEEWDGLGHYPHLVAPSRFVARVAEFEAQLP